MKIGGFNSYNDIELNSVIRKPQSVDETNAQVVKKQSVNVEVDSSAAKNEENEVVRKVANTKPEVEFEFNLKRGKDLNLIGAKSEKEDIDVDKAVSNIQKDSILSQYKFFVNPTKVDNEDGTVRRVNR